MKIATGLLLFILMGCASNATGPVFKPISPKAGKALLYVYRPGARFYSARKPDVIVNKRPKFELQNAGYRVFQINPGKNKVNFDSAIDVPGGVFEFQAKAGVTYYLRYAPATGAQTAVYSPLGVFYTVEPGTDKKTVLKRGKHLAINLIKPKYALLEIRQTRYVE